MSEACSTCPFRPTESIDNSEAWRMCATPSAHCNDILRRLAAKAPTADRFREVAEMNGRGRFDMVSLRPGYVFSLISARPGTSRNEGFDRQFVVHVESVNSEGTVEGTTLYDTYNNDLHNKERAKFAVPVGSRVTILGARMPDDTVETGMLYCGRHIYYTYDYETRWGMPLHNIIVGDRSAGVQKTIWKISAADVAQPPPFLDENWELEI